MPIGFRNSSERKPDRRRRKEPSPEVGRASRYRPAHRRLSSLRGTGPRRVASRGSNRSPWRCAANVRVARPARVVEAGALLGDGTQACLAQARSRLDTLVATETHLSTVPGDPLVTGSPATLCPGPVRLAM